MRTPRFYAFSVFLLLLVGQTSDLAPPSMVPGSAVESGTPLPLPLAAAGTPLVTIPLDPVSDPFPDATVIRAETCFVNEDRSIAAATDEVDPWGEFSTGIADASWILAVYQNRFGALWDQADHCNTREFYQHAHLVKKLRTASLSGGGHDTRRDGGSFGGGSSSGGGVSDFDFPKGSQGPLAFTGGGGGGGGGETNAGGNEPNDDAGPGGDEKDAGGPGTGGPGTGGPGGGGGQDLADATPLPEPDTLALFLGLMAGLGIIRRRARRR